MQEIYVQNTTGKLLNEIVPNPTTVVTKNAKKVVEIVGLAMVSVDQYWKLQKWTNGIV